MSKWNTVLSASELEAYYALMAKLDPSFAKEAREFWVSRTLNQLRVLKDQAWNCNDGDQYQTAASYIALASATA